MVNMELFLRMKALDAELEGLDASTALSRIDSLLAVECDAHFLFEVKVSRAKILSTLGRKGEAIDLLNECSNDPVGNESAAYFAAEILVEQGRFREAVDALEVAEEGIRRSGSTYYKSCIFLLHAYSEFRLGAHDRARRLLAEVSDEDEAIFWINVDPAISVRNMRLLLQADDLP